MCFVAIKKLLAEVWQEKTAIYPALGTVIKKFKVSLQ